MVYPTEYARFVRPLPAPLSVQVQWGTAWCDVDDMVSHIRLHATHAMLWLHTGLLRKRRKENTLALKSPRFRFTQGATVWEGLPSRVEYLPRSGWTMVHVVRQKEEAA